LQPEDRLTGLLGGDAGLVNEVRAALGRTSFFVVGADRGGSAQELLRDVATGAASARITPGLSAFLSADQRERIARELQGATGWTFVGCDGVEGRGIARLGTQVARICYSKGQGAAPNALVTVLYGADWRAAGIDFYSF
jgi:hypothetical protein